MKCQRLLTEDEAAELIFLMEAADKKAIAELARVAAMSEMEARREYLMSQFMTQTPVARQH